jgi:hypothetical protein
MAWLRYSEDGRQALVNLAHVQSVTYTPGAGGELRLYPSVTRTAEGEPASPWVLRGRMAQTAAAALGLDGESGAAQLVEPGGAGR